MGGPEQNAPTAERRYLFFLRHYNDIDNIAPAIYFFLAQSPAHQADVVIYSDDYDFTADENIDFLQQQFPKRFQCRWLGGFLGWTFRAPPSPPQAAKKPPSLLRELMQPVIKRLPTSFKEKLKLKTRALQAKKAAQQDATRLAKALADFLVEPVPPSLIIFDVNRSANMPNLLQSLRQQYEGRIICLPVSPLISYNVLRQTDFYKIFSDEFRKAHDYSAFDAIGMVDTYFSGSYDELLELLGSDLNLGEKVARLGSIRFCKDWLEVRSQYIPPPPAVPREAPLRIAVLLSRALSNLNTSELTASLGILAQFPEVSVVVKGHTRDVSFPADAWDEFGQNISVNNEWSSSTLLDWADLVIFWGSSMALEGYVKGKTMICLDYMASNKNLYATYSAGHVASCRDDLLKIVLHYAREQGEMTYHQEGCDKLIQDVVYAGDHNNHIPSRYLAFMAAHERQRSSAGTDK